MCVLRHSEMNVRADCLGDTVLPVSADCIGDKVLPVSADCTGDTVLPVSADCVGDTVLPVSADCTGDKVLPVSEDCIGDTVLPVSADCTGDTVLPVSADCNPFLDASWFHTTSETSGTVSPAQTGISCRKRKSCLINHPSGMTSQSIQTPRHAKRLSDKTGY
jgi:hypothetical protein